MRGRVLFIDKDNLNTDGIFAGKHTYRDDITPEEMAAVTFENYDPNFNTLYQKGDVVVGGLNFGTGSSREQAATALKFKGIPCVIASSFSETYKRNAFNNGFVVFECPELVTHLRATLTNRTPDHGGVRDHDRLRQIHADHRWKIIPLPAAQSRRPGIDRRRRRRKSGGRPASREAVATALMSPFAAISATGRPVIAEVKVGPRMTRITRNLQHPDVREIEKIFASIRVIRGQTPSRIGIVQSL